MRAALAIWLVLAGFTAIATGRSWWYWHLVKAAEVDNHLLPTAPSPVEVTEAFLPNGRRAELLAWEEPVSGFRYELYVDPDSREILGSARTYGAGGFLAFMYKPVATLTCIGALVGLVVISALAWARRHGVPAAKGANGFSE